MKRGKAKAKSRSKREGKLHANRDAQICELRRRGWTHTRLGKKYRLTNSRVSQILKEGGAMGIRSPYRRPKKKKIAEEIPIEPDERYESPREEAEMRRWERHIRFLNPLKEFEET